MLTKIILETLQTKCDWDPKSPLLVGVSGGADSIALLHALKRIGANVFVGHFNHLLRATATRDAEFVKALCRQWELPFAIAEVEVSELAKAWGSGIEEAARRARYGFLFALARARNVQAVVTAHHADDQVETVLMHFLRGSGLDGLAGMPFRGVLRSFDEHLPILRPLLGVRKAEILSYCVEQGLDYMEDETNQQNDAFRNRLRNQLFPLLETYNPNLTGTLLRNAQALQADQTLLQNLEQLAFDDCLESLRSDAAQLNRAKFLNLEKPLQARVLRHALKLIAPDLRDFSYDLLQSALEAIETGQTYLPLSDGMGLWCIGDQLQIMPAGHGPILTTFPQLTSDFAETWEAQKPMKLADGWVLHREVIERARYDSLSDALKQDPLHAWLSELDPDQALVVRSPSKGDRFAPLGMSAGRQKLSDFFINEKIPQPARPRWPLVTEGDSIVWVVGLRVGHAFRVNDDAAPVLHLWVERPAN